MIKHLSTYYSDNGEGQAEIYVDLEKDQFHITYVNAKGEQFFTEEFPDKSIHFLEDAAENWALGIKKLKSD
jgi:hypothetical protein